MPPVREKRLSLITKMEPLPIVTGNMSRALGGYPAKRAKRADLVAGIYTPQDGVTRGADGMSNTDVVTLGMTAFLDQAEAYLRAGYAVGIADIAFGNGSSKGLIKGAF